jgi:hypothetical protein
MEAAQRATSHSEDFDNFRDLCPSLVDQDQMNVAYVVDDISDLQNQVENAIGQDSSASQREVYVNKAV